jgi:hypothetical protein
MTAPNVLPAGVCLPPIPSGKGAPTPPAARKARKRPRRGSRWPTAKERLAYGFLDDVLGTVPRAASHVWFCLWRDTKADGMACASIGNLARRIRASRNTVCDSLKLLESRGHVEVVRRGYVGGGASVYRVRIGGT